MTRKHLSAVAMILIAFAQSLVGADGVDTPRSENVMLVLIDGLRWQEVFTGAEEALLNKETGGVQDVEKLRADFWRETPAARRAALLPFFWSTMAQSGQLLGNQERGSVARVSNGLNFSYPGYSEMIVGFADPRIDSNEKRPNPNHSVFEWLHDKPRFAGRVAAFGNWDVVPYIFNRDRCNFYINGGFEPVNVGTPSPEQKLLNRLKLEVPSPWKGDPFDALTFYSAMEYLKDRKPRLFYLSFGETDEWAHSGRYDEYLRAAHRNDQFIRQLWETLQTLPEYRDKTTLVIVADHGRGGGPQEWKDHGKDTAGSGNIWIAILGPDTPPLGERTDHVPVTQAQIAATLAAAVGEDYCAAEPRAAPPLPGVIQAARQRP